MASLCRLVASLLLLILVQQDVTALPNGFIAEVVTDEVRAVSGTFAINPRKGEKPILLLLSKWGNIYALENPDESPSAKRILDLGNHICTEHERGLHNILVVEENSSENSDKITNVYIYYTTNAGGCSPTYEPWNVLDRFTMDSKTLLLDFDSRTEIWRYVRNNKVLQ
jgi:hypothetical protein